MIYHSEYEDQWAPNGETWWNGWLLCPEIKTGTYDDGIVWTLDSLSRVLTVSGSGNISDYADGTAPWYTYRTIFEQVVISDGITKIGAYDFNDCPYITSVSLPETVTSIGKNAFAGCTSLLSADIPEGVKVLNEYVFSGCTSLETAELPIRLSRINKYAFSGCSALTSVNVPDSVIMIGDHAFADCAALTSINIPQSISSIPDSAFRGCSSLTAADIPDSVTSIGDGAFGQCSSLVSVDIPNSVTTIGSDTFTRCTSLASIIIPDSVTSIGCDTFAYCTSLESVTLPQNLTSIQQRIFMNCTSLASIIIPDNVIYIDHSAFSGCISLSTVTIPASVRYIRNNAFGNCSSLRSAYFLGNPPTSFESDAFYDTDEEFTIYYLVENTSAWAPNGQAVWNGYPIAPIGSQVIEIHYIYENGINAAPTYSATYPAGSYYSVASPAVPGYVPDQDLICGYVGDSITVFYVIYTQADIRQYSVLFADWDGTLLKSETVAEGGSATPPEAPVRDGYTFTGWSKSYENTTEDTVIVALYEQNMAATFTVCFVDWDGSVLKIDTVNEGGSATPPENPVRDGYTFTGWDKDFSSVYENMIVTAQYEKSIAVTLLGDVNCDGAIDAADALLAMRYSIGIMTLPEQGIANGDMDNDGYVSAVDAILIMRLALQF